MCLQNAIKGGNHGNPLWVTSPWHLAHLAGHEGPTMNKMGVGGKSEAKGQSYIELDYEGKTAQKWHNYAYSRWSSSG